MKEKKNLINWTPIICIITFFLGVGAMYGLIHFYPNLVTTAVTKTIKDVTVNENGIADAVEKVYDSVVVVENYQKVSRSDSIVLAATGTGFAYKKENNKVYILTNYHVIKDNEKVNVLFSNDKSYIAKVEGGDSLADIAVLSIETDDEIVLATLGSSESGRVGDTVFAVGAPLDSNVYSWSVTRGVLSGKDRLVSVSTDESSSVDDWKMNVLQTDTAINSGNSGGPLCNSNGEVIGITSMKLASEGIEGMGFAIPIEIAKEYADRLENGEKIERPYIGISMQNVSALVNSIFGSQIKTNLTSGVYVADVSSDSPASEAGMKKGDIIVKIGDNDINDISDLKYHLYKYQIGDIAKVVINRDGKEITLDVTLNKAME